MSWLRRSLYAVGFVVAAAVLVGAVATRHIWGGWLATAKDSSADNHEQDDDDGHIELSPQASIDPQLKPVFAQSFERKLRIPARIVTQPGRSKRIVSTHILGVIEKIYAYPGEVIRPGDKLFDLHLVSDHLQEAQDELHRTSSELAINKEEQQRLKDLAETGAVSAKVMLDLQYQQRKLQAVDRALRHKLSAHGLPAKTIDQIAQGNFIKQWTIYVPKPDQAEHEQMTQSPAESTSTEGKDQTVYELGQLNVQVGTEVQPGAPLCTLLNLAELYVEGQVFGDEIDLIKPAILNRSDVEVEIANDRKTWPDARNPRVRLKFMSHEADAKSQTVSVYGELGNPFHTYRDSDNGKTYRLWRYRPGQRAYLRIPVESFKEVFVLPRDAVVRDGSSAYVFRKIGDMELERTEVKVLYQDRKDVVLAKSSLSEKDEIAHNAADQLYRELMRKAQGGGSGHGHHHHD